MITLASQNDFNDLILSANLQVIVFKMLLLISSNLLF